MDKPPRIESKKTKQEEIALGKLEKLLSPTLVSFAVRFMNIGEYEKILRTGMVSGPEVYQVQSHEPGEHVNFSDYLKKGKGKWSSIAQEQTEWENSTVNLEDYKYLMKLLRESREEVGGRNEVLKKFREKIINKVNQNNPSDLESDRRFNLLYEQVNLPKKISADESTLKMLVGEMLGQQIIDQLYKTRPQNKNSYPARYYVKEEWEQKFEEDEWVKIAPIINTLDKYIEELGYIGEKRINIASEFLNNPNYFIENKDNLRLLINAISYSPLQKENVSERQYHIAMIFETNFQDDIDGESPPWIDLPPNPEILGVIAAMPDKELYKKLIEKSSQAALKFAHPVFDSQGIVRWPKKS